jgi:Flp pilus assembly protein TadG
MYPCARAAHNLRGTNLQRMGRTSAVDIEEGTLNMGPKSWAKRLRERRENEEGAELVEFAIVIMVFITLVYGIISFAMIFLTQTSAEQAADDASHAALATYNYEIGIGAPTSTAQTDAANTAQTTIDNDLSWLRSSGVLCASSAPTKSVPVQCATTFAANGSSCASAECLTITTAYDYGDDPLIPDPVLGLITPKTLTSTVTVSLP